MNSKTSIHVIATWWWTLGVLGAILLMPATGAAAPVSLIDFERGTAGWTDWSDTDPLVQYKRIEDQALCHGGRHCMEVRVETLNKPLEHLQPSTTKGIFENDEIVLEPNSVYRFTAHVRSPSVRARPMACVDWFIEGVRTLECSKPAKLIDDRWQALSLVFKAPVPETPGRSVAIRFFVSAFIDDGPDLYYIDDLSYEALSPIKYPWLDAKGTVQVSDDVVTQINLAYDLIADPGFDDSAVLVIDVPEGVSLLGTMRNRYVPRWRPFVRPEGEFRRFRYPIANLTQLHPWFAFEQLYFTSGWAPGMRGKVFAFLALTQADDAPVDEAAEAAIDIEAIQVGPSPRFARLSLGAMDWIEHGQIIAWTRGNSGYFDMLEYLGVDAFAAGANFTYFTEAQLAEVASQVNEARSRNLEVRSSVGPFYVRTLPDGTGEPTFPEDEWAKSRDGELHDYFCPGIDLNTQGVSFDKELDRIARAVKPGFDLDMLHFDWEPLPDTSFCELAINEFKEQYDHDPVADDCHTDEWVKSGGNLYLEGYNECGRLFRDFQTAAGTDIWKRLRQRLGSEIELTQWQARPGHVYNSYTDLDALFPDVFRVATPEVYPQWPVVKNDAIGRMVRRVLLGVLSNTTPNLAQNGGVENGGRDLPDFFGASADPQELRWDRITATQRARSLHGERSLRITKSADGIQHDSYYYYDLPVDEGERYLFAASASRSVLESGEPCLGVVWLDGNGHPLDVSTPSDCGIGPDIASSWERLTVLDDAPQGATTARMKLYYEGGLPGNRVWFDEIRATRPNMVNNGGFERGTGLLPDGFAGSGHVYWSSDGGVLNSHSVELGEAGDGSLSADPTQGVFGNVPYQLTASVKGDPNDSNLTVTIEWLGEDGAVVGTDVRPVRPSAAHVWGRISFSIESPASAAGARLIVTGRRCRLDDVDFRMDGPYVVPWMTAGWYGREIDVGPDGPKPVDIEGWEIDSREVKEQMLESYVAGAQTLANHPAMGIEGADHQAMGTVKKMLAPYERILADGTPIPESAFGEQDGRHIKVMGMAHGEEALLLTSGYLRAGMCGIFNYRTKYSGALYRVNEDGSLTFVKNISPTDNELHACVGPDDDPRAALFYFNGVVRDGGNGEVDGSAGGGGCGCGVREGSGFAGVVLMLGALGWLARRGRRRA